MPTGYTQMIIDGKVKTPKEFLHLCLRNFGVCVCMKDEEFKIEEDYTPKIKEFYQKNVDYHKKNLKSAEEQMEKIQKLTDDELYRQYVVEQTKSKEYYAKELKTEEEHNSKLFQFAEKIRNWECSPEYNNIKNFALEQLEISQESTKICRDELERIGDLSREDFETKKEEYKNGIIESAKWQINYHTKEMKAAESRMEDVVSFYNLFKQELEKIK